MIDVQKSENSINSKVIEIEFSALRSEILQRIQMRQQLLAISLTLAGVFISVGLSNSPIAFVFTPLATFLAAAWAQNDIRIRQLGKYILEYIEPHLLGLGWEKYRKKIEHETRIGVFPIIILSPAGIFLFTQFLAIGIGLHKFSYTIIEWILLLLNIIAVILTFTLFEYVRKKSRNS